MGVGAAWCKFAQHPARFYGLAASPPLGNLRVIFEKLETRVRIGRRIGSAVGWIWMKSVLARGRYRGGRMALGGGKALSQGARPASNQWQLGWLGEGTLQQGGRAATCYNACAHQILITLAKAQGSRFGLGHELGPPLLALLLAQAALRRRRTASAAAAGSARPPPCVSAPSSRSLVHRRLPRYPAPAGAHPCASASLQGASGRARAPTGASSHRAGRRAVANRAAMPTKLCTCVNQLQLAVRGHGLAA